MNGAIQNVGPDGRVYITVDATVGSNHHQVRFLKEDLAKLPTMVAIQKFVAQQCKATDDAASGITGAPSGLPDFRGTVTV